MSNSTTHFLAIPIANARYSLPLSFRTSAGTPTDPTSSDTEFSTDGGATFSDCAEEITTGGANGMGYLTLSGAETNVRMLLIASKSSNCLTTPAILQPHNLPVVSSGTLSAGSATGGTLGTILAYDITGCYVRTTGGTGGGGTGGANNQARRILTYNVGTGAFTVSTWETTPDATTTYDILLPDGMTLGALKALNPTTSGRTLDVSATGEGGVDWANVGSPTTAVDLSNTTIKTTQQVDLNTIKTQAVTCAAGVTVNTNVGTTQPVNFTGTGASALVKSDTVDIAGAAVNTALAQVGATVVGYASGQAPLQPTTSGRTLDVTATGEAGIDWSNIGAPTTVVGLSGTTVKTATDVEADTQDIQSRLPAALASGRMDSSVGAYQTGLTPLQPTTAGRTLDVTATGEAGIDWSNIGAPTTVVGLSGTTVKTATDVETDTQDIQSRLPAALTGAGNMKSDALALNGSTTAADNLSHSAKVIGYATVTAGASTTSIPCSATFPVSGADNQFKGRIMIFADDTATVQLRGQGAPIDSYTTATATFTVTAGNAFTTAPSSGDVFSIL